MARIQRKDRAVQMSLDKFASQLNYLKIVYEKYFSGRERLEPGKEREAIRRAVRELERSHFTNHGQRYRFQMLKARFISLDQYIQRNLHQIERGTHRRFTFRADMRAGAPAAPPPVSPLEKKRVNEEKAFRAVFDQLKEARGSCGQSTNFEYQALRKKLASQVKSIKKRYKVDNVRFRISVEDGQAKLKAIPVRKTPTAV